MDYGGLGWYSGILIHHVSATKDIFVPRPSSAFEVDESTRLEAGERKPRRLEDGSGEMMKDVGVQGTHDRYSFTSGKPGVQSLREIQLDSV